MWRPLAFYSGCKVESLEGNFCVLLGVEDKEDLGTLPVCRVIFALLDGSDDGDISANERTPQTSVAQWS